VHNTCSVDEWKAYKEAAGRIYFEMFVYVLEPLFKKHPSLKKRKRSYDEQAKACSTVTSTSWDAVVEQALDTDEGH